ncbi:MAG: surface/cell-adhesion protein, partial [Eubacteriales bacterium]
MKNKFFTGIVVCCLSVLILLAEAIPVFAIGDDHTVNDAASVIDGIVAWNLEGSGEASVQEWIDGTLTQNAGSSSEWYILTLT